jgi:hypothetical protein
VIAGALVLRGIGVWVFARMMSIAALRSAGVPDAGTELPVWVLVVSASLIHLDLHRRKETMLLNNLGVTTIQAVCVGTIPALMFETALLAL